MNRQLNQTLENETRWWLALNGSSCAPSPYPLPATLRVVPKPELLLGFHTREEQTEICQFILTATINKVHKRIRRILKDKRVLSIVSEGPPQPPSGETHWLVG